MGSLPVFLRRNANGGGRPVAQNGCHQRIQSVHQACQYHATQRTGPRGLDEHALGGLCHDAAVVIASHMSFTCVKSTQALCRMYDNNYSPGNETLLIDTMKMLKYTGDPWEKVFDKQVQWTTMRLSVSDTPQVLPNEFRREHSESFQRPDLAWCEHG